MRILVSEEMYCDQYLLHCSVFHDQFKSPSWDFGGSGGFTCIHKKE